MESATLEGRRRRATQRPGTLGPRASGERTHTHDVGSKAEVDAIMAKAKAAGAVLVKPAKDTFDGSYAGYVRVPDGHLWEPTWNPQWTDE